MEQIWKPIKDFEHYYEVSNIGNVRRIAKENNSKTLKPRLHSSGYLRVMLSINGKHYDKYIHRLVADMFCVNANPNKYFEINHKDGDKQNNIFSNLEWCDRSYNNKHAYVNRLHTIHGCYGRKKKVAKIDIETNKILSIYDSVENASKDVGLKNFCNISACCNYAESPEKYKRPCLTSKGYKWRFIKDNSLKIGDIMND